MPSYDCFSSCEDLYSKQQLKGTKLSNAIFVLGELVPDFIKSSANARALRSVCRLLAWDSRSLLDRAFSVIPALGAIDLLFAGSREHDFNDASPTIAEFFPYSSSFSLYSSCSTSRSDISNTWLTKNVDRVSRSIRSLSIVVPLRPMASPEGIHSNGGVQIARMTKGLSYIISLAPKLTHIRLPVAPASLCEAVAQALFLGNCGQSRAPITKLEIVQAAFISDDDASPPYIAIKQLIQAIAKSHVNAIPALNVTSSMVNQAILRSKYPLKITLVSLRSGNRVGHQEQPALAATSWSIEMAQAARVCKCMMLAIRNSVLNAQSFDELVQVIIAANIDGGDFGIELDQCALVEGAMPAFLLAATNTSGIGYLGLSGLVNANTSEIMQLVKQARPTSLMLAHLGLGPDDLVDIAKSAEPQLLNLALASHGIPPRDGLAWVNKLSTSLVRLDISDVALGWLAIWYLINTLTRVQWMFVLPTVSPAGLNFPKDAPSTEIPANMQLVISWNRVPEAIEQSRPHNRALLEIICSKPGSRINCLQIRSFVATSNRATFKCRIGNRSIGRLITNIELVEPTIPATMLYRRYGLIGITGEFEFAEMSRYGWMYQLNFKEIQLIRNALFDDIQVS